MINDISPQNMEMLFVLFGLIWTGVFLLGFALYLFIRKLLYALFYPLPQHKPTPGRWTRDWESLENNINK